jgi:hypothetical protein
MSKKSALVPEGLPDNIIQTNETRTTPCNKVIPVYRHILTGQELRYLSDKNDGKYRWSVATNEKNRLIDKQILENQELLKSGITPLLIFVDEPIYTHNILAYCRIGGHKLKTVKNEQGKINCGCVTCDKVKISITH